MNTLNQSLTNKVSDIYVDEDGSLHKVKDGADTVLPFNAKKYLIKNGIIQDGVSLLCTTATNGRTVRYEQKNDSIYLYGDGSMTVTMDVSKYKTFKYDAVNAGGTQGCGVYCVSPHVDVIQRVDNSERGAKSYLSLDLSTINTIINFGVRCYGSAIQYIKIVDMWLE